MVQCYYLYTPELQMRNGNVTERERIQTIVGISGFTIILQINFTSQALSLTKLLHEYN